MHGDGLIEVSFALLLPAELLPKAVSKYHFHSTEQQQQQQQYLLRVARKSST
jgi:hypothetical protein